MERPLAKNYLSRKLARTVGALFVSAFLALLTGCQGVSAGGSSSGQSALSLSAASLNFGSVVAGSSKTLTVLATNSGSSSIAVSGVAISSKYFALTSPNLPVTIASGQSASMNVMFSPNATGTISATVTVTSDASNPSATLALSGTGVTAGQLTFNSSSEAFGNVTTGTQQSQTVTLTNSGGTSVNISQATVSGSGFQISGITTPLTLSASQSTNFTVTFAPQALGSATGTVTINSNASDPTLTLPLTATGVSPAALTDSPSSLGFGNVTVGSNESLSETVTNAGGSSLTISQVGVSGTEFRVSGISTPLSLGTGQSATFSVTFSPTSVATASGSVTITSSASTLTIPLSGTGAPSPGQLALNPSSENFGSVITGTQQSQIVTLTNIGGTTVNISQATVSGVGFQVSGMTVPLSLNPSQSTTLKLTFAPLSTGNANGTLTITSDAGNPTLTMSLSGTGIAPGGLGSNPTSLNFGNVTVGNSSSLSETVTNTGGSSVTISQVAASGTGFSLSGISTPLTLAAGQATTFTVTFAPTSPTSASGNVTVTSNASNPSLTIPLSGTGTAAVGQLSITPATLNVGSVVVGTSGSAQGNLNATGANVTVTVATTNNSVFSIGGLSLPVTIPAGQSVPFTITFSPLTTGVISATLTITSNAQPSTSTESLTGTGLAAATHSVALSWTASTSGNIAGYNIYRTLYTTSCGTFSKVNTMLNSSTTFTDSTVINGASYCYAATAVDTTNAESGYSNIVSNVQIPVQ